MTTLRADISLDMRISLKPATPLGGGTKANLVAAQAYTDGTTANKADKVFQREPTLAASGNTEIDLQTATDTHGVSVSLDEVVAIGIEVPAGGGGLKMEPGSSNGWTGFIASGSINFPAGTKVVMQCPSDPAWPVSPTSKTVKFSEYGGTLSVTPKITFLGRSS